MNIRQTHDLQRFARRALPYLHHHEAEHNLLLALIEQYQSQPQSDRHQRPGHSRSSPLTLISVDDGSDLVAVAIQMGKYPLLLSKATHASAIDAIAFHIKTRWPSAAVPLRQRLRRFSGPPAEAACLAAALRHWTPLDYQVVLPMRIHQLQGHQLRDVQTLPRPEGHLRPAGPSDRDRLVHWIEAFEQEVFGALQEDSGLWSDRHLAQGDVFFWETEEPVSMVVGQRFGTGSGRIGPVYTPPYHRRQGYGSAAVAELSQRLLISGAGSCYLFTDSNNSTSNHIYGAIGYEPIGEWNEYGLSEPILS